LAAPKRKKCKDRNQHPLHQTGSTRRFPALTLKLPFLKCPYIARNFYGPQSDFHKHHFGPRRETGLSTTQRVLKTRRDKISGPVSQALSGINPLAGKILGPRRQK